jgi:hypothetical protein
LLADIESESVGLLFDKINTIKKGRASQEVIDESKNILRALINNSYSNKYHFLPKNQNFDAGLINFQRLSSIKIKEFNTDFTRVASINSNFTKDIVARFSYYYSRQGSPDFNTDEVYRSLF